MGHPTAEDGAGRRGLLVHVGVEVVAGAVGEALDVVEGDGAAVGAYRGAELQVVEVQLEGMAAVDVAGGAGYPLPGHRGEHVGRALHCGGLEVVADAPQPAQFLSAAGPTGAAVNEGG